MCFEPDILLSFQVPSGQPLCGWDGEFCESAERLSPGIIASIGSAVAVVLVTVFAGMVLFHRYRYNLVCLAIDVSEHADSQFVMYCTCVQDCE